MQTSGTGSAALLYDQVGFNVAGLPYYDANPASVLYIAPNSAHSLAGTLWDNRASSMYSYWLADRERPAHVLRRPLRSQPHLPENRRHTEAVSHEGGVQRRCERRPGVGLMASGQPVGPLVGATAVVALPS